MIVGFNMFGHRLLLVPGYREARSRMGAVTKGWASLNSGEYFSTTAMSPSIPVKI
jgi:hypothetical protein